MASAKTRNVVLWTLSLLLTGMFLLSGSGKLANGESPQGDWDAQFVAWGFPAWMRWIVGGAEILAAIGLLVPRLRFYAAAGLVGLMVGAVGTHLANVEFVGAPIPLVLAGLAAIVAWMTRPDWVQRRFAHRGMPAV
jgi:putative oxidoreductase